MTLSNDEKSSLKSRRDKFQSLSMASVIGLYLMLGALVLVVVLSLSSQATLLANQEKFAKNQILQQQNSDRSDCIREIQGKYFYDFSQTFSLTPADYSAFQKKLQTDAIAYINAGDTCTAQIKTAK